MIYVVAGVLGGFALTLYQLFVPKKHHETRGGKLIQLGVALVCATAACLAAYDQQQDLESARKSETAAVTKLESVINQNRKETQKTITEVGARLGDVKSLQDLIELQRDVFKHSASVAAANYIESIDADLEKSKKLDAALVEAAKGRIVDFHLGWQSTIDYCLAQFDAKAEKLVAAKRAVSLEKGAFSVLFTNASEYVPGFLIRTLDFGNDVKVVIECSPALFENGTMTRTFSFDVRLYRGASLVTSVLSGQASFEFGYLCSSCLKPSNIQVGQENPMKKPEALQYMDSALDFLMREALKAVSNNPHQEGN